MGLDRKRYREPQEWLTEMDNNASLARYSVLVLPDLGELTLDAVRTLDDFVARGGRVLATGSSGFGADGGGRIHGHCAQGDRQVTDTLSSSAERA
jgi:hypothetical protein